MEESRFGSRKEDGVGSVGLAVDVSARAASINVLNYLSASTAGKMPAALCGRHAVALGAIDPAFRSLMSLKE